MSVTQQLGLIATLAVVFSAQASAKQVIAHYIDIGDQGRSRLLAADAAGKLFVVSTVIEPWGEHQIRVTKTDPAGNVLASIDFGGSSFLQADEVAAAAVDSEGNLVIAGSTYSQDFPLVHPLFKSIKQQMAFVLKFDSQLQHILFSTVLGGVMTGPGVDASTSAGALVLDAGGNIYIAGSTNATDFPVTANAFQTSPPQFQPDVLTSNIPFYAFIAEISADGTKLIFSTFFGSSGTACSLSDGIHMPNCSAFYTDVSRIRLDHAGNIVIAGNTDANLPITPGSYMAKCDFCSTGYTTGYLAKLAKDGSKLLWATYLTPVAGALVGLTIYSMALAGDDGVIVGGVTAVALPVTPGALQPAGDGGTFVAKLDSAGQHLVFATYLGSFAQVSERLTGDVMSMAVDALGTIWVTGASDPSKLPVPPGTPVLGPLYTVGLSPDGTSITDATTAPLGAAGIAVAITEQGAVVTLGEAGALLLETPTQGPSLAGSANSAATKVSGVIAPMELISFYGAGVGPATPLGAKIIDVDNIRLVSTSLGGVRVLFNGIAAPLLYVGPTQINAVVPWEVYGQETAQVEIQTPNGTIDGLTYVVRLSQPEVFRYPGTQYAAAINQDGTINSANNPAAPGSIVSIWCTGTGVTAPGAQPDGQILPGTDLTPQLPVSVLRAADVYGSAGDSLELPYVGDAYGMVQGVTQINLRLPVRSLNFRLQVGAALSEPFDVYRR